MKAQPTKANHMNEILGTKDLAQATVGWIAWGTGTVGITKGETLRLSDLPPENWSSANDTPRPILEEEGRCGGVVFRRSRSLGS